MDSRKQDQVSEARPGLVRNYTSIIDCVGGQEPLVFGVGKLILFFRGCQFCQETVINIK